MTMLTLKQAAEFSRMSGDTIRRMIESGDIRAAKVGRGFKFLKDDFIEDLRNLYGKKKVTDKISGKQRWVSTGEKTESTGSYASLPRLDEEYRLALKLTTGGPRSNSMTK